MYSNLLVVNAVIASSPLIRKESILNDMTVICVISLNLLVQGMTVRNLLYFGLNWLQMIMEVVMEGGRCALCSGGDGALSWGVTWFDGAFIM